MQPPRIDYLCLQVTEEGQASYAHVHEIVEGLKRLGFSVSLFEPRHLEDYGVLARMREFWAAQRRLIKAAEPGAPIYIRAHFATLPTAVWARRTRRPVIQEVNGPYEDLFIAWPWTRRFRRIFEAAMRWQYKHADAVVTVTEGLRSWLRNETGRDDVQVVPNGANVDLFTPDAPRIQGMPDRYAVFVGALAPWQGVPTLLRAVAHPAWPEGVSLVVVGDGELRPDVEAAASNSDLVVYASRRPYREVPGILAAAITALVPKTNLGDRSATGLSPLKLYEALACGVPVIATDFPGQREVVNEANAGILIDEDDAAALARAVDRLAANPAEARAMGARGRDLIVRKHSWAARAGQTADIIRSVSRSAKTQ